MLAVSLAMAEGRPARRSERRIVPRLATTIEGEPAVLLDVSTEGLRLEMADDARRRSCRRSSCVHVPVLKVGVPVQRVWVKRRRARPDRACSAARRCSPRTSARCAPGSG